MIGPKTLVGSAFLLLGLIFAIAFGTFSYRSAEIVWSGVEARGEVLRMQKSSAPGSRSGRSYNPIVRFTAADGSEHVFRQRPGGRKRAYEVGEEVDVLYLESDPDRAVIDSFWGRYGNLFGVLFALCFVWLGAWLIRWDRRENAILDY